MMWLVSIIVEQDRILPHLSKQPRVRVSGSSSSHWTRVVASLNDINQDDG